ncbi:hypothetical protein [Anatilimnocola aggregata]|nr:hypothetical protein [Anatilimnocola aggregata]
MLGYEPSEVESEIQIADYARCAFDLGISPQNFLTRHNPMFHSGQTLLAPYVTRLSCFAPTDYQIVCINNLAAPFSREQPRWQGTLHTATILSPDDSRRRVINSTMIGPLPLGIAPAISPEQLHGFVVTTEVRRQGYDKRHLSDDQ